MEKTFNMSVKEYLMRTQSVRTNIPLKIIEAVVNHQFKEAYQAMENKTSMELSGFGKFIFNDKKAKKMMLKELSKEKMFSEKLRKETDPKKIKSLENKLNNTKETIKSLKPRIKDGTEFFADNRGVEEQTDTTEKNEGDNREDI